MIDEQGINPHIFCLACGYNQHGIEVGRCPECGATIDVRRPETYTFDRPISARARSSIQPIGWPMLLLVMGCVFYTLWFEAFPDPYGTYDGLTPFVWSCLLIVWAIRLAISLTLKFYYNRFERLTPVLMLRWTWPLLVAALMFFILIQ